MKNWRTTIIGIVLASMIAIQPLADGNVNLKKDWHRFTLAIGIAVFGYFSKDKNVTGV